MTLKHFIDRPVLAAVISIVIVLGGIIGVATLPVEQYPDIAPPTVMVRASYPGASAETIQKSVIIPLEEACRSVPAFRTRRRRRRIPYTPPTRAG